MTANILLTIFISVGMEIIELSLDLTVIPITPQAYYKFLNTINTNPNP